MTRSGAEKSPRLATTKFSSTPSVMFVGLDGGGGLATPSYRSNNNILVDLSLFDRHFLCLNFDAVSFGSIASNSPRATR